MLLKETIRLFYRLPLLFLLLFILISTSCKVDHQGEPYCQIKFKVNIEEFYEGCTIPITIDAGGGTNSEPFVLLLINDKEIGKVLISPSIFYLDTDTIAPGPLSVKAIYSSGSNSSVSNEKTIELLTITTNCPESIIDFDGNIYPVTNIGNQCWVKENLKPTHYSDGVELINGIDSLTIGGPSELPGWYFAYDREIENADLYGYLYTWSTAMKGTKAENGNTEPIQGICPEGWHIPSQTDWITLIDHLGGFEIAGDKLKDKTSELWIDAVVPANDENKFLGLPAGERISGGSYNQKGEEAYFWTSTETIPNHAYHIVLNSKTSKVAVLGHQDSKRFGYSVRCIKD